MRLMQQNTTMNMITATYNRLKYALLAPLLLAFMAPNASFAQECPEEIDNNERLMNYSLYYEAYKNKDYQTALPYLNWMLDCAPGFTGKPPGDDRNFERGVNLFQGLSDGTEDATAKREFLDKALGLFDNAVPTLQSAGAQFDEHEWLFNKGRFIQRNAAVLDDMQSEAGPLYMSVYEGKPDLFGEQSAYYIRVIIVDMARKELKQEAVDFMDDVESKYSDDSNVMAVLDEWRGKLFDSPEERMSFLEEQLDKKPGDLDIISELIDIYKELEERDKLSSMIAEMLELNPSPKLFVEAGVMKINDGDTNGAIEDFNKALGMEGGDSVAKEANFNLGNAYRQNGNLSRARSFYRSALRADPEFKRVYSEIAGVYAEAVSECGGSAMEREDRAVYWLVADYLERAGDRSAVSRYKPYFPSTEDLFFKGWTAGESYSIDYGCYSWINETTKIRKP